MLDDSFHFFSKMIEVKVELEMILQDLLFHSDGLLGQEDRALLPSRFQGGEFLEGDITHADELIFRHSEVMVPHYYLKISTSYKMGFDLEYEIKHGVDIISSWDAFTSSFASGSAISK